MNLKVIIASCAAFGVLAPVWADTPSTSNAVFVGGTPIMRVRTAAGGYTADQRAGQIQERLNLLLGQGPIAPSDITVQSLGNEAIVAVKGHLLFTADWATAHFNSSTPMELANKWAANMRTVLPALTSPK